MSKSCSREEILEAARQVVSGGRYFAPVPAARVESRIRGGIRLTVRQCEAIAAYTVAAGLKGAADLMGVKEDQVEEHLGRCRHILGARNNSALVLAAVEHGFVSPFVGAMERVLTAARDARRDK